MASISTRSSRRTETLNTRSSRSATLPKSNSPRTLQLSNIGRKKRPRESDSNEDQSIAKKRVKIAVEILSHPKPLATSRSAVLQNARLDVLPKQSSTQATQTEQPPTTAAPDPPIHRQKFANGIKHELDRLGPTQVDVKAEKRKLRSQEGTRFKSSLSRFFPEYDEVIGNDPREDYILDFDSSMTIGNAAKAPAKQPSSHSTNARSTTKQFSDSLFIDLHQAKKVDFSFMESLHRDEETEDPMAGGYFQQIHRRPERQEKTIRNNDKGLAQHEREEVKRILQGLHGHDWLKEMGVSGVTESKKKEYEPARDHFIKGCQGILEKFRTWKEEEKRRKLEKEWAIAEAEAEAEAMEEGEEEDVPDDVNNVDHPDLSDIDASAERQLHDEAIARSAPLRATKPTEKRAKVELKSPPVEEMDKPFTSFFPKPYLRDAALSKHRRSGRSVAAWGHPVPELVEVEFDLPEELRDEETLRVHARRKRRDRRVSKD